MHFDSGDQLIVIILAVAIFMLAHEQTKLRRQLRELQRKLDQVGRHKS